MASAPSSPGRPALTPAAAARRRRRGWRSAAPRERCYLLRGVRVVADQGGQDGLVERYLRRVRRRGAVDERKRDAATERAADASSL
jgi:hypothetical protein